MWDRSEDWQCLALREVPLSVRLGVYPEERARPQPITVAVELWRRTGRFEGSSLADCLDYDRIYRWLAVTWPNRPHVDLLETLTEELIAKCFEDERVEACRVKIRKLAAYGGRGWPEIDTWRRRPRVAHRTSS